MRGFLHFTAEGLSHLGPSGGLWLVVPELLLVAAAHIRYYELHVLLYQLALLPGDRLALVSPGPDLTEIYLVLRVEILGLNISPVVLSRLFPRE